jgi:hypothetical protein
MAVVMCFKVHYHFEGAGGKKSSEDKIEYVQCGSGDYASIKAVLSSNSKLITGATLVIDSVVNVGGSGMLA